MEVCEEQLEILVLVLTQYRRQRLYSTLLESYDLENMSQRPLLSAASA